MSDEERIIDEILHGDPLANADYHAHRDPRDERIAALEQERDELQDTIVAIAVKGLGLPPVDKGPCPPEWEGLFSEKVAALRQERDELAAALVAETKCSVCEGSGVMVGECMCIHCAPGGNADVDCEWCKGKGDYECECPQCDGKGHTRNAQMDPASYYAAALTQAKVEALRQAAEDMAKETKAWRTLTPSQWLRERADEIEKGEKNG